MENKYRFLNSKNEHLHQLNVSEEWKPLIGTSTVLNVLAKPLTWWAAGLAVKELGWTNPKEIGAKERLETAHTWRSEIVGMDDEEYLKLLDKAYQAHSVKLDKSAEQGTDMHAELEKYVKLMISDQGGKPMLLNDYEHPAVEIFAKWAVENVKEFLVSEGHCYSKELWCGGVTDCIAELKSDQLAIIDFKSAKEAYMSHFIQVGGYDLEASENGLFDENGKLIVKLDKAIDCYIVFPFGAKKVEPKFNYDVEAVKKGFASCLQLYKLINNK